MLHPIQPARKPSTGSRAAIVQLHFNFCSVLLQVSIHYAAARKLQDRRVTLQCLHLTTHIPTQLHGVLVGGKITAYDSKTLQKQHDNSKLL